MKPHFFCLCLVTVCLGCEPQAPVLQQTLQCYARFDAAARQTKAEATLKEGPDANHLVPVEPTGGFHYQGVAMHLLPIQGITYQSNYNAVYQTLHRFTWKDKMGQALAFEAVMPRIDSFYFTNSALSVSSPATLCWTGGSLEKGETLVLLWENPIDNKTVSVEAYNSDGIDRLEIPSAKMAELSPGRWSLYLVRKRLTKGRAGTVDASGIAEYYTKAQTFDLK